MCLFFFEMKAQAFHFFPDLPALFYCTAWRAEPRCLLPLLQFSLSWACELQVSRIFGVSFCVRQKKRLVSTVPWLLQNLSIFHWRNSIIAQRMANGLSYYTMRPLLSWNSHFCVSYLAGYKKEHPCHVGNCFDLLRVLPFLFFCWCHIPW